MRSKFFRNFASFDSIDKMRLPRSSNSRKIYHIYPHNSLKAKLKGRSVRHLDFVWSPDLSGRVYRRSQTV